MFSVNHAPVSPYSLPVARYRHSIKSQYNKDELKSGKGLVCVSSDFHNYICMCEATFNLLFEKHCHDVGICNLIVQELVKHNLPVECEKFPKLLFLRYFVRMRIYYVLKFKNAKKDKKIEAPRKDRKLSKLSHE